MGFDPNTKHKTTTTVLGPIELGKYALLRDEKTLGTPGGTFSSGARRTRDLNTKVIDEIGITLSSNQFTLPAGTYRIWSTAPHTRGSGTQSWIRNVTDGEDAIRGTSTGADSGATAVPNSSVCVGQFTITASKTFELQHQIAVTSTTTGFGSNASADVEVYAVVEIIKVP
ncbi:MAG: hypothetical protein V3T88_06895 [Nitrosomonadaceae bacterium]